MSTLERLGLDLHVGPVYALTNVTRRAIQAIVPMGHPWLDALNRVRQRRLETWFTTQFADVMVCWKDSGESAVPYVDPSTAPLWMMWVQGVDQMPDSCNMYLDTVRRCNPSRPLHLVDLETVRTLVDIPEVILRRHEEGGMPTAHLSDYLRFLLLERYGGIWMDLTLYQTGSTPDWVLRHPAMSVKGLAPFPYATAIPDALQWQVYYMAAQPHALFNRIMLDLLESYWSRFHAIIDYFQTYYLAHLARTHPVVAASYRQVPRNNTKCELPLAWAQTGDPMPDPPTWTGSDTWFYKGSSHMDVAGRQRFVKAMDAIGMEEREMQCVTHS